MTAFRPIAYSISRPDTHTIRLSLGGHLIYDTANEVLHHFVEGLAAFPATRVVHVDCADVELCDSHGLSILLMVRRATTAAGARLELENLPKQLTRMLEITGTLDYLTACPSRRQQGRRET